MVPSYGDLTLFVKWVHGKLGGIKGAYVDDSLVTGTKRFDEESRATERRFDSKPRVYNNLTFSGIQIQEVDNGNKMHQEPFVK